jgi:uncharacterized DUF497 family protein
MDIEFDPAKRLATIANRGLDMADAAEVFADAVLTVADTRLDYGEDRFMTVGYLKGRMVIVIWTMRGTSRRIISLRKANEREQDAYRPPLRS